MKKLKPDAAKSHKHSLHLQSNKLDQLEVVRFQLCSLKGMMKIIGEELRKEFPLVDLYKISNPNAPQGAMDHAETDDDSTSKSPNILVNAISDTEEVPTCFFEQVLKLYPVEFGKVEQDLNTLSAKVATLKDTTSKDLTLEILESLKLFYVKEIRAIFYNNFSSYLEKTGNSLEH